MLIILRYLWCHHKLKFVVLRVYIKVVSIYFVGTMKSPAFHLSGQKSCPSETSIINFVSRLNKIPQKAICCNNELLPNYCKERYIFVFDLLDYLREKDVFSAKLEQIWSQIDSKITTFFNDSRCFLLFVATLSSSHIRKMSVCVYQVPKS